MDESFTAFDVWMLGFSVVWIGGWLVASIVYRKQSGKPIFTKAPPNALFRQSGASGRDMVPIFRSIGGAGNVLLVAVTRRELIVSPTFPFTLLFLPEIWGLEYRIPLMVVQSVERRRGLLGTVFRLDFLADGQRRIELRLRRPDDFTRALEAGGVKVS